MMHARNACKSNRRLGCGVPNGLDSLITGTASDRGLVGSEPESYDDSEELRQDCSAIIAHERRENYQRRASHM